MEAHDDTDVGFCLNVSLLHVGNSTVNLDGRFRHLGQVLTPGAL
jgi:hypothetical protein